MHFFMHGHHRLTTFFILLLFLCPLISSAQTLIADTPTHGGSLHQSSKLYVKGSRYLYDEFIPGEVYDENLNVRQVPLRLNLHNDALQYLEDSTIFDFANPSLIEKIFIGDEVFIYIESSLETEISGFVKKWNSSYPAILTKMKTSFFKKTTETFGGTEPHRFARDPDLHYLMKSDSEIIRITSVKDLIETLGAHSTELYKFAREEKVSKKNGAELAKLMDYYHSLTDYQY